MKPTPQRVLAFRNAWPLQGSPILDLDFIQQRYYWGGRRRDISELTFSGGANATYVDLDGVLRAGRSLPRLVSDIATGSKLGVQVEGARTNLALWSDDFTQAATWIKTTMTAAMTATGPDGVANSATTLTAGAANDTILQTIVDASAARITSVYIKRRTGSGTINITHNNGTTWTAVTVTSAWTRVNNPATTAANPVVGIRIVTSGDAVDVYGFQHEDTVTSGHAATVSSLARTTTASVAKTGDLFTLASSAFGLVGNTGLSVRTEHAPLGEFCAAFELQNSAVGNQEQFILGANNLPIDLIVRTGSSLVVNNPGGTTVNIGTFCKSAGAIELNNARQSTNGALDGSDDVACTTPVPDTLYIGTSRAANSAGTFVKRLTIWNYRLPNGTLQQLTA